MNYQLDNLSPALDLTIEHYFKIYKEEHSGEVSWDDFRIGFIWGMAHLKNAQNELFSDAFDELEFGTEGELS